MHKKTIENINGVDKVAVDHVTGLASVEGDEAIHMEVRYIILFVIILMCILLNTTRERQTYCLIVFDLDLVQIHSSRHFVCSTEYQSDSHMIHHRDTPSAIHSDRILTGPHP